MYLKTIEVNGFKSFANKLTFQFHNGITGIVGPNGSGKSNVGDAVRWVLGEQSAKQLRGSKMEDVIFAGTELRKPQGSAYVAITLDNSDHKLPIDYNEVTVARRVYRSGESEYLINGVVSRLKDVHSLFFDTGIGKEGYSIIGQGQIERILSGKPEERRELFDEAAGIVKYKKNKAATEKSLESERENLARVNDILKELERQVGPLKEQSETARRYLIFKDELKKLDINAFLLDVDQQKEQLSEYESKLQIVEDDVTRLREEFDQAKDEYERIENQIDEFNTKIDDIKNEIHEKKLANQRCEGEIRLIDQQIQSGKQNCDNIVEQLEKAKQDFARYEKELTDYYTEKTELDEKLDCADELCDDANRTYEALKQQIADKEASIEHAKGEIIEFLNEGGTLKAKVGRYDTMLENINLRKTELNKRFLEKKSEQEQYLKEKELLSEQLAKLDEEKSALAEELSNLQGTYEENSAKQDKLKDALTACNNSIVSLGTKKEALRNLTERYDGYGNSIRRVMEQKQKNPNIIGVVADILEVPKQYQTAIETALGGSIQNVVTEDAETAKQMITYLKQNHFGRATFLPIQSIVAREHTNQEALNENGVIGLASNLVSFDSKYMSVINHLLGRIIVVDHIDHAISISRKYKQTLRIVTLEGELINPGGAMTGGAFKNTSNLLGRKRELDEIDAEIVKLQALYKEKQNELSVIMDSFETIKEHIASKTKLLGELEIRHNTYALNYEQADNKLTEIERIFAGVARENKDLDKQVLDINTNKEELFNSNRKQEDAIRQLEELIKSFEEQISFDKVALEKAAEEITRMNVEFNTVKQQYDFMMQNIKRVKGDKESAASNIATLKARFENENSESALLYQKIEMTKQLLEENNRIIKIKELKLSEYITSKEGLQDSHKEFFNKREALSEQINGLDKSAFRLNASIEKISEH
ncbi:MAG: chromosome segregation protein SMC, partial [Eubacteriales bacterium]|nr:chromosome segregation protein SMC [Eubacteriales bacterium]